MPDSKQAKKRLRQTEKRTARNSRVKLDIAYMLKQIKKSVEAKDKTKAQEWALKFQKAIDKAAKSGLYHKNTAARKKSRIITKLNALK